MLSPLLRETCTGRLSEITWFRSAWQAGGASTGIATFELRPGRTVDAVVKLPVGPSEYRWTVGVGSCPADIDNHDGPTPRVLAAGNELGGYDLAWIVLEKLPGHPVSTTLDQPAIESLLQAAAEWYARAAKVQTLTPDDQPRREDWPELIARCRHDVKDHGIAHSQRWNDALRQIQRCLSRLTAVWDGRAINTWCHGDLHPGNAMRRTGPGGERSGRCVLIDLALVHPGHWVEDALYLERLYWGKPELLCGVKPVSAMAKCRREVGMPTDGDYTLLANVRRVLMAATVPAFLEHEGHPKYVHAALEHLEKLIPIVSR